MDDLFFCLFVSFPPSSLFFPCGKIVLKKEGTSVQPRSHPCTVWIRAEASANRAWPRYSGPGTTALPTRTQVRLKSKFSKQTQVSRHLPAGEPTHSDRHKIPIYGIFSPCPRGILDYFFLLVRLPREASGRMGAWVAFLLLPASPPVLLLLARSLCSFLV